MYASFKNQCKKIFAIIVLLIVSCKLVAQDNWTVFTIAPPAFGHTIDSLAIQANANSEFMVAYLSLDSYLPLYRISISSYPKEHENTGFLHSVKGIVRYDDNTVVYLAGDIDSDIFIDTHEKNDLLLPENEDDKDLIDDGVYSVNKDFLYDKNTIIELTSETMLTGEVLEYHPKNENPFTIFDMSGRRLLETCLPEGEDNICIYYTGKGESVKAKLSRTRIIFGNKIMCSLFGFSKMEIYYDIYSEGKKPVGRRYVWQSKDKGDYSYEPATGEISHIVPTIRYGFHY